MIVIDLFVFKGQQSTISVVSAWLYLPFVPIVFSVFLPRSGWSKHFIFCSMVFRVGGLNGAILVTSNPSWRQAAILDNFEWS